MEILYEIVSNVNYILSVEHTATGDENELKCVMAQAYAARAFAYFMLIQSFQQTYKKHETWPGVPVYTEPTTSASKGKGRGTVEQVYTQINDDLTAALTRFEECGIAQEHISNLDYYATSLLSSPRRAGAERLAGGCRGGCRGDEETRPFAAQQDRRHGREGHVRRCDEELDHGQDAVQLRGLGARCCGVRRCSRNSLPSMRRSSPTWMPAPTSHYAAETPKCISNWLYAQIPDTDVRKGWWNGNIGIPAEDWSYGANINYNQHKFQWADQKAHKGDYIFMRLEEAYLIRAEALCRMGTEYEDEARSTLLELGSRRDTEYARRIESLTGGTQTSPRRAL
ncbi:MAG: RagB/SusD family nutrient uptake outer membrane protein [Alistipes finegoldii]